MSIPPQISVAKPAETRWGPETLLFVGWRYKGRVLAGVIVGLLVSAAVGMLMPHVYQSSAQISVVKKIPDRVTGIDTRSLSAEENISPPQDLLKSSLIINRAIESKGLNSLPIVVPADQDLTEHIRNMFTIVAAKVPPGQTGQTFVFKLNYRDRNDEDSRTILTALLDSYKEFMDKRHQAVSEDTIELILRDKKNLEEEIAKQDAAYRSFRDKAPLLGKGKDGSELRQERLNTIQARRSALLLQRVELEGQLNAIESAQKQGRSQDVIIAMLVEFMRKNEAAEPGREKQVSAQDQLLPLLMEERKLVQVHGPNHAEVKELRNRIDIVRRLLILPPTLWKNEFDLNDNGVTKSTLDPVNLHVQLLKQKLQHIQHSEESLANLFQTEQDEARRMASFEIQNDAFRTRATMNQQLYEALVKRLNEVNVIRNVGGYQIELLEPPSLGKKVAPNMPIALMIGGVLGLGLGIALACWAEARAMQVQAS